MNALKLFYSLFHPLGVIKKFTLWGDSGGGGAPSQQTQTQVVDLPEWAKPTAERTLAKTEALTTDRPFRSFAGQYDKAGNQIGFDVNKVVAGFNPMQQQAFQGASQLQPSAATGMGMGLAGAAGLRALGARYNPYQTGQFGEQAGDYMSPFIQQALEPQMREARRQSEIQRNMDQAQAVGRGAFGGSRQAIVEAERQRNLGTQLGDIQARGLQTAFDQARQQFNTEQQLREQSRQYGAGLGMQGLQTALTGAGQLGQLGGQQFGQQRDIIGLQSQFGSQQQQLEQSRLNAAMQDFAAAQRYPYQQLEFMSNIMRGTPMGSVQSMYQAAPTPLQTIGALGTAAYGFGQLGQLGRAAGGTVSSYAEGGSVTDSQNVESIIDKLSDAQLQQARQIATARRDAEQIALIDKELAERASMRSGLGGAFNALPMDQQENVLQAANGGIVAFSGDEDENDEQTGQMVSDPRIMPVGRGDLPAYGAALTGLQNLYKNFKDDKGYSPLTPEEEKAMYERSTTRGKEIYGNVLDKIKANIESERNLGEQNLRQARGLAAIRAAGAMLEPGGFVRGLGRAGSAFSEAYGRALEADATQKRSLTNMELNLAKAEADQRMGLHERAEARIAKANADRRAAYTAGVNKTKAEAVILNNLGRLALPPAPQKVSGAGAPKPQKLAEQLGAAEVAYETNPTEANQKRVTALRRAVSQTRTSDIGPGRAAVETFRTVTAADSKDAEALKGKFTDPDWMAAYEKQDPAAMAAAEDAIVRRARARRSADNPAPGVNPNSTRPPKAGKVEGLPPGATVKGDEVYDSNGKLIGHLR